MTCPSSSSTYRIVLTGVPVDKWRDRVNQLTLTQYVHSGHVACIHTCTRATIDPSCDKITNQASRTVADFEVTKGECVVVEYIKVLRYGPDGVDGEEDDHLNQQWQMHKYDEI